MSSVGVVTIYKGDTVDRNEAEKLKEFIQDGTTFTFQDCDECKQLEDCRESDEPPCHSAEIGRVLELIDDFERLCACGTLTASSRIRQAKGIPYKHFVETHSNKS